MALLAGVSALVLPDAGSAGGVAWLGAGVAALLLVSGIVSGSAGPIHAAVAVLGAVFLARQDARLLLAAPVGAALLLIDGLAMQTIELREVDRIVRGTLTARTAATLSLAALGACVAAAAALAVSVAPARSVWLTAIGAVVLVTAFAAIACLARRRFRTTGEEPPLTVRRRSGPRT